MQTQLTLNIDNQTIEMANFYAKENGLSVNELFEKYIRLLVLNEQFSKLQNLESNSIQTKTESTLGLKKTNWKELDKRLMSIRHGLPSDYQFDRELANER